MYSQHSYTALVNVSVNTYSEKGVENIYTTDSNGTSMVYQISNKIDN